VSAASDFAMLARLPPADAIAYMLGRSDLTVTHNWQDLWQEEHARQFTVSRLARLDLLQSIHDSLSRSVAGDLSRRDWMRDTERLLTDAGWWGEKQVLDPATGEMVTTRFNPARLALIYDTNTRQAAAAGQWERIQRTKRSQPYLRYITMRDNRVRPAHQAWDNVTLPVDDPFWEDHFPPNGWRCRCRVTTMSEADYQSGEAPDGSPLIKQAPREVLKEFTNSRTGEVSRVPVGIDPGFDYNAGIAKGKALALAEAAKLRAANAELAKAAQAAGLAAPNIAREVGGQSDWQSLGLADLRAMTPGAQAPEMLPGAQSVEAAKSLLRAVLGVPVEASRAVMTPVGRVTILDDLLEHVVEKRTDARERYANFVLPTLMAPDEVWQTSYDDNTVRLRFIKMFSGAKYDILVVVNQLPNGQIVWNVMNRTRKDMNAIRVGTLLHQK
jgi:SPP1 gp7 family putative phage head morphogenesis protein